MATKVMSVTEYSREESYEPFLRFLYEQGDVQHFNLVILEDKSRKPDTIVFRSPGVTKDSTIELRPAAQGFDIYVGVVTTGFVGLGNVLYLGLLQPEARIGAVIAKAASRAKAELANTQKTKTVQANFCTRCGASLPLDAIYCPKCGSKQT
jgi:ribosomal protein L40E